MVGIGIAIGAVVGAVSGVCGVLGYKQREARKQLLTAFRSGNVLVAGHKGNGKDLLFSYVIKQREKDGEIHAANIRYTDKTRVRAPNEYRLYNNSIRNFVTGNFNLEGNKFTEKEDYYISEAGLAFPNWAHTQLEKDKSTSTLPITFALSRHLGQFNIHANAQEFGRIWDKLREQADWQIYCEQCGIFFKGTPLAFARIRFVVYQRYESAYAHIQPYEVRRGIFRKNKDDLIRAQEHNARYGFIKRFALFVKLNKKKEFNYNTREFYTKLYQKEPPIIEKSKKQSKKAK